MTYPDHPAKTVADVIKSAQADPGKLTCATAGNGTGMHLAFELFAAMAKAKIQHIPYRGSPQAITDLAGQARRLSGRYAGCLMPFISDGRLRAIAVTGPKEFFMLPGVPTVAAGGVPGYSVTSWLGLAGPAGLPPAFVANVNAQIKTILADPVIIDRLRKLGSDIVPTTPQGFRDRVADDVAKWTKIVADANIPRV